jgi:hypothetical protein
MAPPIEVTPIESFVPASSDAGAPKVYSKESAELVRESWAILSKDAQANAVAFFKK